jgi:hypothetical protein
VGNSRKGYLPGWALVSNWSRVGRPAGKPGPVADYIPQAVGQDFDRYSSLSAKMANYSLLTSPGNFKMVIYFGCSSSVLPLPYDTNECGEVSSPFVGMYVGILEGG